MADAPEPTGPAGLVRRARVRARHDLHRGPDHRATAEQWPVEAGRYRLVVARACPWANRAIIVRRLLGLEDAISMGICGPTHDADTWTFDLDPGRARPGAADPAHQGRLPRALPGLPEGHHRPGRRRRAERQGRHQRLPADHPRPVDRSGPRTTARAPRTSTPRHLRAEIDEVNQRVYTEVNNGVYRCGFAGTQEAYDAAYERLFTALDWLEERLSTQRYLVGDTITEADVRLFTTLARFDAVYHGHFKCNRTKLSEMPVLWAYARDLFQTPGFGDTTDFVHIKSHYYEVHRDINPTGVVPAGPDLSGWATPHGRESLGGRPFGDGTPPGPPPEGERVPTAHNPHVGADGLVTA